MHCLHEGIGKKLFQLWFTTSSNRYYIGQSIELISNHLTSVKPPDTITRTPCPLSTRKKWKGTIFNDSSIRTCPTCTTHLQSNLQNLELQYKPFTASEYRAWLLFYCLPVLNGILPPTYLKYLALLVCRMHILLGDRISQESLPVVEYMLDKFYCQFEELYGKLALHVQ